MSLLANTTLRYRVCFLFCLVLVLGLYTTHYIKALPSMVMMLLVVVGVWHKVVSGERTYNPSCFFSLAAIFLLSGLSLLYTDLNNLGAYKRDIVMKLPLLALPLAFAFLPPITQRQYYLLYYLYLVLTALAALVALVYYLTHFQFINEEYLRSHVMFTVVNYVRYSLMLAFGIVVGAVLYHKRFAFRWPAAERRLQLGLIIFLFAFMHVLAVRSGLVAFYALAGLFAAWLFFAKRQYKQALLLGLVLLVSPVISYTAFPTFRNKFYNTVEDVERVDNTRNANNYSIVGRVYSYKTAWEVIRKNPFIGVGIADMKQEIDRIYARDYPTIKPSEYKMPHNQFLYYLAAFGSIGLLAFVFLFYYPLHTLRFRFEPLLLAHYFTITVSFIFEFTLETQLGILFSLLFILLPLYRLRSCQLLADDAPLTRA